jgi:hypothetical protein
MRQWWKQIVRETSGAEIAEAAVVLPLVFMLLLGIYWFGRAYNIYSTATQAAQVGAGVAAKPYCAICTGGGSWSTTSFPNDATVITAVQNSLSASKLDPAQVTAYTLSPAPTACVNVTPAGVCTTDPTSNITVCRNVQLNPGGAGPQECGTVVSFHYPYQFYFPFTSLNFQLVNLPAAAANSMEY